MRRTIQNKLYDADVLDDGVIEFNYRCFLFAVPSSSKTKKRELKIFLWQLMNLKFNENFFTQLRKFSLNFKFMRYRNNFLILKSPYDYFRFLFKQKK